MSDQDPESGRTGSKVTSIGGRILTVAGWGLGAMLLVLIGLVSGVVLGVVVVIELVEYVFCMTW